MTPIPIPRRGHTPPGQRSTLRRHRRIALWLAAALAAESALVSLNSGAALTVTAIAQKTPTAASSEAPTPASSANSTAEALLMARLQNRKIEVSSERSATTTTYALPSGELQTSAYAEPVRTKADGKWRDIDTSLSDNGASLEPKTTAAEIALSNGGDKALALVTRDGTSFGIGWQETLPKPEIKDDTAVYGLGDGQKLTVTALSQGFSQNVLLNKAPDAPLAYRIPVKLDGLKLSEGDGGHLLLKDGKGNLVAEAPAPAMWDSSKDPRSGEPKHQARIPAAVETAADGSQTLVLTPAASFFDQDPTYPVTVDPTTTLAVTTDTWVATNYTDSQVSSDELKTGTYDAGATKARSYLKFDVAAFKGKRITDTNLGLYSYYSSTCQTTGSGTQVRRITGSWDSSTITWGAQPATTDAGAVTSTAARGYNSSCPAGTVDFDTDAIVQAWADGQPNHGLQVRGVSETDSLTWRRFRSANYVSGDHAQEPHLSVTYTSYPGTPTAPTISPSAVNAYNGTRYVTSLTPTLSAKVTDPDGGTVHAQFEISPDPAYNDTTYTYTGTSAAVASGANAPLTLPTANKLPSGPKLRYRVRGYDGTVYGPWSAYQSFGVNTALPAAPSISCASYEKDTWIARASEPVTCTLDTTATDGQGYLWGLNDTSLPHRVDDKANGTGGDALTISINPADGWHTLHARTVDAGGNVSTDSTAYAFGVGADGAAVLSPQDGDTTARRLTLAARGKPTYTGVTWQYRRGETDTWRTVPIGDVTAAGSTVAAWPVKVTAGTATPLVWNAVGTLAEDGLIELRSVFTDGTTSGNSQTTQVTLDRDAGTAPQAQVGPGEVNQLTGDYTVTVTDASAFDANVTRTYSSRANDTDTEGQAQIFGAQWSASVRADGSDNGYTQIRKTSDVSVELLSSDGGSVAFTATAAATGGWQPEPGSESLTLTGKLSGATFTLKDSDANVTVFAKADDSATTWSLASTATAVDDSTVTVASETVTEGGKKLTRPKYVVSPTGAVTAAVCLATPSAKGCRVTEFVYAASSTATTTSLGDYANQVKAIRQWATNPGADAATAETLTSYTYDSSGRLRQVWDPRASPALKIAYTYDADGRMATVTEPGEQPWTFTYGKAGSALTAGAGMLMKVSRPTLAEGSAQQTSGTAVTTVVYDVPLTGAKAPRPMGAATVASWAQEDAPTDATAVFPADAEPASSTGGDLAADAYARATVSYINANGEEVNTATPGGGLSVAEYDAHGNIVTELSAVDRALALDQGENAAERLVLLGLTDLTTAARAELLSSKSVYAADGWRLLDEYGSLHPITLTQAMNGGIGAATLPAGTVVNARTHVAYTYDENRPSDAVVADLVTTTATGASVAGYPADGDVRRTSTTYDWATGQEADQIQDPGGKTITTRTTYDAAHRTATTRRPASDGADAGTLVHAYYTADGTGTCGNRPEWAGLLCRTTPAANVTGGGSNPAVLINTIYTYDRWGRVAAKAETAGVATRTTTNTLDTAGRTTKAEVTGGIGTATPATTYTYDQNTGRTLTQSSGGKTVTNRYDTLGRLYSYDDGAGNVTTTVFDALDRPVKITDSAPSTVTYTYDTAGNRKTLTDSAAGTFEGTYDVDGNLTRQTLPGGNTLTLTTDSEGHRTGKTYTAPDGTPVLSDTAAYTAHGRQTGHTQSDGVSIETDYAYDGAGRLTQASDTTVTGCVTRAYAFDANSNRTSLTTRSDDCDSATDDTVEDTVRYAHDSADRLTTHTYDDFGRTTAKDGTDLAFYTNDLATTQTRGSSRSTWQLDAAGRLAVQATESKNGTAWQRDTTVTNHYGCACDSPTWTTDGTTVTRYVSDLDGDMTARTPSGGATVLQLSNLQGDIAVQLPLDQSGAVTVQHFDEYGRGATGPAYGWLGSQQRATAAVTGDVVMGVRLYDRSLGRFLSADPVYGGSCNAYEYVCGDPVSGVDLGGTSLKYRDQHACTKYTCIGIRRSCDSKNRCALSHYLTFRKHWRNAYIHRGAVWTISVDGFYVKKETYSHGENGKYKFHGYWYSNNKDKGRGWFKCSFWTCRLDPGDKVIVTWAGTATLGGRSYGWSAGQTFSGGGRYHR
ncbi:DNRLRE domain-containing protein [Streptomyces sp. A5-4]|uniref:DNRLRE domain-containing protein n=1 Tax=Streptomyces sp. A5-4 TaxID=3384771 RepID=UPI003DA96631